MNYFSSHSAAERYAKGRPYFHPRIVERIKAFLAIAEPLPAALDVGCGTGLSTLALKDIAQVVVGVDISAEMIAFSPREERIQYVVAPAENLPSQDDEFDVITLSQVFHWLDRDRFLIEANRVLRPEGWLIAYSNDFVGQLVNRPEFHNWSQSDYLVRYPAPPRGKMTLENTDPFGFRYVKTEQFENTIKFSLEELIDYLVTQSNIIAVVEGGKETISETRTWLTQALESLLINPEEAFLFRASIWYLQCITRNSSIGEVE